MLTEAQVAAVEKAKREKEAPGEFASEGPGYCGAQATFYVGPLKGGGRIAQQPCVDTSRKVAFANLYDRKTSLTAADLLKDQGVPFFEDTEVPLSRILTDRGTEDCGSPASHEYELDLALENIAHPRTKVKSPQPNGIVERLHKTLLTEVYRRTVGKKIYTTVTELQADLDEWLRDYHEERVHQGRWCYGRTPLRTCLDTIPVAKEQLLAA
jgi:transposase InsO family protein